VFLGNLLGSVLAFIFSVLVSRSLGPSDFGLFSVVLAVLTMVSDISDFGANTSMVRFATRFLEKTEPDGANRVISLNLKFKTYLGIGLAVLGYFSARWIAEVVFKNPLLVFPLKIVALGIMGILLFSFFLAVFQSYRQFKKRIIYSLALSAGRVILLLLLIMGGRATLINSLWVYILLPFFLLGPVFISKPFSFVNEKINEKNLAQELFHFSKWLTVSNFAVLVLSRLDIFMLVRFSGPAAAGIYSAAFRLASLILLINSSFTVTLLPEIFRLGRLELLKNFFKKFLVMTLIINICLVPLVYIGPFLIKLIYGAAYADAGGVFQILVFAFMFMITISALEMIIYALNKPQLFALMMVVSVILSFGANYLLIPVLGARGAAWALLGVKLFGIIYLLITILEIFSSKRIVFDKEARLEVEGALATEEKTALGF
jgi:stage V sporulation protein B